MRTHLCGYGNTTVEGHSCVLVTQRGWGCKILRGKRVTEVYGSTLLALRGGGWVSNVQENSVT